MRQDEIEDRVSWPTIERVTRLARSARHEDWPGKHATCFTSSSFILRKSDREVFPKANHPLQTVLFMVHIVEIELR